MDNYIEHYLQFRKDKATALTYKDDKYLLGVAKKYFKDKDIIEKYVYLYSIDKYILNEQPDVINCIKTIVSRNKKVNIGVYKLISE